jgi:acetyl-CoA C-acetyltransferase
MTTNPYHQREVFIVDGSRTPFLKAKMKPGPFTAADLAVAACKPLLERLPIESSAIEAVITGCTIPSPDEMNIARIIALRLGLGHQVPAYTVHRNCASGMQAIDNAVLEIASGRYDLILAGGVDAMSHAPLLYNSKAVNWFSEVNAAKTFNKKLLAFLKMPLNALLKPIIAILRGLTDPVVGLSMGQTAEKLAYRFNISRQEMDEFALRSHELLIKAQEEKLFPEIKPIFDREGNVYQIDDGVRPDTTLEKLAKLRPFFDKKYGKVTAGNSSQVTDGAAFFVLASKEAVKKYQLPVIAKIIDCEWAALDPAEMGLGPVHAVLRLMDREGLTLKDIDLWEINEAFAAQVIACLRAWDDQDYCQKVVGVKDKLGKIDEKNVNINGGAIAMGHPIGASGVRIVMQLISELKQHNLKRGIATICIGGGQGGAMLIETVT